MPGVHASFDQAAGGQEEFRPGAPRLRKLVQREPSGVGWRRCNRYRFGSGGFSMIDERGARHSAMRRVARLLSWLKQLLANRPVDRDNERPPPPRRPRLGPKSDRCASRRRHSRQPRTWSFHSRVSGVSSFRFDFGQIFHISTNCSSEEASAPCHFCRLPSARRPAPAACRQADNCETKTDIGLPRHRAANSGRAGP